MANTKSRRQSDGRWWLEQRRQLWLHRLASFKPSEEEILAVQCADYLRGNAPPDLMWWHTANEGQRKPSEWQFLAAMGFLPGICDLTLTKRRRGTYPITIYVELKARGKKLRPAQVAFINDMSSIGAPVYVIDSFAEFKRILTDHNML